MVKTLCIRFDIDTPTCLAEGVPRLLDLTDRMGFRATFFLSVGRAISRTGALTRAVTRSRARTPRAASFSSLHKLGWVRYLKLALLNPEIGRAMPGIVDRLAHSAEVGLHGGRNHDTWQNGADTWPRKRVESEVDWALSWLADQGIEVAGFSSPGWTQPESLAAVLQERGFLYRADRYGADLRGATEERPGFYNLATNLLGEPAGVAYLEHLRARGLPDAAIRARFRADLGRIGGSAVMYDHPFYAGLHALDLLGDLVDIARDEGYTLVTLAEMARGLPGNLGRNPAEEGRRR